MNPFTHTDANGNYICPVCEHPTAMFGPHAMALSGMCNSCVSTRRKLRRMLVQAEIDAEVEKILTEAV